MLASKKERICLSVSDVRCWCDHVLKCHFVTLFQFVNIRRRDHVGGNRGLDAGRDAQPVAEANVPENRPGDLRCGPNAVGAAPARRNVRQH